MPIAELHMPEVVCLADSVDIAVEPESNRRTHERLKAGDLQSLRSARIKYGADVRVIDLSVGGMLLETENRLAPDANLIVELTGPESPLLLPSRVLRCRIASLGEIVKYHGACAFKRPLKGQDLAALAGHVELDDWVRALVGDGDRAARVAAARDDLGRRIARLRARLDPIKARHDELAVRREALERRRDELVIRS